MAQRIVHYLFGELITQQVALSDKKRFLLGSIIPDSLKTGDRDRSHFKVRTATHVYLDFKSYRNQFLDLMMQDDFYLGYYMHLVEDAFYRTFIYQDRFSMPRTQEEIALLHNDYHILNSYIVRKYHLHNELEKDAIVPVYASLDSIADFQVDEALEKLSAEFTEQIHGSTVFLTENMLDEFITTYIPLAVDEVRSLKSGKTTLKDNCSWLRRR